MRLMRPLLLHIIMLRQVEYPIHIMLLHRLLLREWEGIIMPLLLHYIQDILDIHTMQQLRRLQHKRMECIILRLPRLRRLLLLQRVDRRI